MIDLATGSIERRTGTCYSRGGRDARLLVDHVPHRGYAAGRIAFGNGDCLDRFVGFNRNRARVLA